jgi:hypothetical protein
MMIEGTYGVVIDALSPIDALKMYERVIGHL